MWKANGKPKVLVGMSGGVDSSVAASLLLDQGYDVAGAFMKNWSDSKDPRTGECAWKEERRDAMRVAASLGIPFETFDFEEEYDRRVVDYLYREYAAGRTPNPDVLCNREVKFDLFLKEALARGADFIATGHYARVAKKEDGSFALLAGLDRGKDQSYFVHALGQEQLKHVLFPIGHLDKRDVRAYARDRKLETADKKDSQGICFIGKVELREFLRRELAPKPGAIVTVEGRELGRHGDVQAFTIGQRHGLGVGGGPALYVVATDVATGTVTVAEGADHPALFKEKLAAGEWHWVSGRPPEFPFRCRARIRYRQPLQGCEVRPTEDGGCDVRFDVPQRAVTPGQFIVLYDGDEVVGGGVILE
ncbi:MAG TPA: tRNA 2-thiouridine(34) synthase MnmA [Patescibacteria group bacterium]|nr:tRNA 2-thiouridine(34) synthase MnmA [Patescibacteria group bacterium]